VLIYQLPLRFPYF